MKVNPQAPVAQKIADWVVFRRFQGEGSFEGVFYFSVGFIAKSFFRQMILYVIRTKENLFKRLKRKNDVDSH